MATIEKKLNLLCFIHKLQDKQARASTSNSGGNTQHPATLVLQCKKRTKMTQKYKFGPCWYSDKNGIDWYRVVASIGHWMVNLVLLLVGLAGPSGRFRY